ncbi:MAG: permease [Candidatus Izemoplasmataceae bacterium]
MKTIRQNKFLIISLVMLVIISIVDIRYAYKAFDNTYNQIISMLIIVPPIFILIGLFDVWVPKETVIKLMGEKSGARGMFLAFFLGAFSAGPTIAAFPLAMIMLKKGASYSNVIFFLMVWSSLKLPIVFYQITTLGLKFSMVINTTMLIVFIISALLTSFIFTKEEKELFHEKALNS